MNELQEFFENNQGNCIDKWMHYFDIYEFWFKKYKNTPVILLEIGVFQGGSLNMWRSYFGDKAQIYAIDINPQCKQFETDNIQIFVGSQDDPDFLKEVKEKIPKIDILIDDGGHAMTQQITAFEELYDHIKDNGMYICEDLHTSYWDNYGGGFKKPGTFIEYSKNLIDYINSWHSRTDKLSINEITRHTWALHFYPSLLIVEKKLMEPPTAKRSGKLIIPLKEFPLPVIKRSRAERLMKVIKKRRSAVWKICKKLWNLLQGKQK